jgi:hypothetical protein
MTRTLNIFRCIDAAARTTGPAKTATHTGMDAFARAARQETNLTALAATSALH